MRLNYAERARALVGTRFRPQGRVPDALDCIGVILKTFEIDPRAARDNYRLRVDHRLELEERLLCHFRQISVRRLRPGDVVLMRVADDQVHTGVRTNGGFVHAHASIGSVVETPGMPQWSILSVFRKLARPRGK